MKNSLTLVGIAILFYTQSIAARKIEGYYINQNSTEKVKVVFLVPIRFLAESPNYLRMQTKITYLVDDEEFFLSPKEVQEVSFAFDGKPILMRSVFNNIGGRERMFLNVVADGRVCYYNYYESSSSGPSFGGGSNGAMTGGGSYTIERNLLQRGNGELVSIGEFSFKKDVAEFLSDCPAAVKLVNVGQLTELADIIKWYNSYCRPSPSE